MANIGIIAALCSATAFGSFIATVPLFYQTGGDPLSIMLIRILMACVFFGSVNIFLWAVKGASDLSLPRGWRDRLLVAGFGLGIAGMGLCYLQSVSYIPVSLAVMIFFTWPIVTVLCAPLLGRSLPGPRRMLALFGAFLCLLPAIGPQLEGANIIGIIWAGCASLCLSVSWHIAYAARGRVSGMALAFGGSCFAVCVIVPSLWVSGFVFAFDFPVRGWWLAAVLSCFYVVGLGCQVLASRHARPEFVSIFYNVEPIVTLFGAYLLLGERLGFWQYTACGGVILCLFIYKSFDFFKEASPHVK